MSRDEHFSYSEVKIETKQAAVAPAKIVMTDGPAIDTTLEEALAYLEMVLGVRDRASRTTAGRSHIDAYIHADAYTNALPIAIH